ncbi:MAG: hypothetical protein RI957_1546 [Verrucomicrobiota bacterium]|jgi:uncharacterized membrane protein YfcA
MSLLAFIGAALIGLSLGLTGAGGSIITLPVLVYLAGVSPREAVSLSLFIVGTAALVGAVSRWRAGEVHAHAVMLFSLSGMAGAWIGSRLTHVVPTPVLMLVFAGLMIVLAVHMLRGGSARESVMAECRPLRCLLAGLAVGCLTGFIGVGGGFLLVPALVHFARLPLGMATGTSLTVIAFNSCAGFLSHYGDAPVSWPLALTFAGIAAFGVLTGTHVAKHLPARLLRQGFACLILLTGAFVLWQNWP